MTLKAFLGQKILHRSTFLFPDLSVEDTPLQKKMCSVPQSAVSSYNQYSNIDSNIDDVTAAKISYCDLMKEQEKLMMQRVGEGDSKAMSKATDMNRWVAEHKSCVVFIELYCEQSVSYIVFKYETIGEFLIVSEIVPRPCPGTEIQGLMYILQVFQSNLGLKISTTG